MTEHQADATQVDAEATAQEAADSTDDSQRTDQASEPSTIDSLPEWAKKEIRSLRKEAGTYRNRVKEFEDAQKTEGERQAEALKAAEDRAKTFEQRYREAQGRISLTQAASAIPNVYDSDTVADLAMSHLEYDDNGQPTNVSEAIDKVRELRPRLFPSSGGSGDGGRGNGQDGQPIDLNAAIRQQLGAR